MAKRGACFKEGFPYPLDKPGFGLGVDEAYAEELAAAGREEIRG